VLGPCGARVAHLEHRGSIPGAQGTRAARSLAVSGFAQTPFAQRSEIQYNARPEA